MSIFGKIQQDHPVSEDELFLFLLDSEEYRMQEIVPGIWLGNQCAAGGMVPLDQRTPEYLARTLATLKEKGVTHILCLAENLCVFPADFKYCQFRVADHNSDEENELMFNIFHSSFDFLQSALAAGGKILVHCNAGMSRSASVVISYLMRGNKLSYISAVKHVRSIRKCIDPRSFESALLRLEASLTTQSPDPTLVHPPKTSKIIAAFPNCDGERETAKLAQLEGAYPMYHEILEGRLFLGVQGVAGIGDPDIDRDAALERIKQIGITHIVNCTGDQRPFQDAGIDYFCAMLPHRSDKSGADDGDGFRWADLEVCVPQAVEFIEKAIVNGGRVYVHCNNGENRSAAVVTAFLMRSRRWGFDKAYIFVRDIRVVVNTKLDEFLIRYEDTIRALPGGDLQFWGE